MLRIRTASVLVFALVGLFALVGAPSASASSIQFTLTDGSHCTGGCAPGPFGTIDISTIDPNTVDVLVTLVDGNKFVDTGSGHETITWNIFGTPAITIGPLPSGFELGPSPVGVPGMGTFDYSIHCPGCGPGASHANPGPLEFTITAAGGLTPEMFIANDSGYTFSADIIAINGNTGSVGSFGRTETTTDVAAVPEPASIALLGTGLLGLCRRLRTRRNR
jgi:hypothetical protein